MTGNRGVAPLTGHKTHVFADLASLDLLVDFEHDALAFRLTFGDATARLSLTAARSMAHNILDTLDTWRHTCNLDEAEAEPHV